jgi:hypothetical protein
MVLRGEAVPGQSLHDYEVYCSMIAEGRIDSPKSGFRQFVYPDSTHGSSSGSILYVRNNLKVTVGKIVAPASVV